MPQRSESGWSHRTVEGMKCGEVWLPRAQCVRFAKRVCSVEKR